MMRASAARRRSSSITIASIGLKSRSRASSTPTAHGMHPNDGRVVSSFIVKALRNENITIFGDGRQTRSFCYRDDLVGGLIKLMATGPDVIGPMNLGNPYEITIRDLAEQIIVLTGSRSKIVHMPLPQDDPRQRRPDITRAQDILGWTPTIALKEGLRRTIAYFDDLFASENTVLGHAHG